MIHKFLATLLLMAVLVIIPAAAAQANTIDCITSERAHIVLALNPTTPGRNIVEERLATFTTACPNISVELLELPILPQEQYARLGQLFANQGAGIDIVQFDILWAGDLAEHLHDMQPYLPQSASATFVPALLQNNTINGKLVGIPWYVDTGLLYYRADLLAKYGYAGPPSTWDELAEMAAALQAAERAAGQTTLWGYIWQTQPYENLTANALEWQYAASSTQIISPEGVVEVLNDENMAAFEQATAWIGSIAPP
ncbi:extracellular solute-binding protein [Chloroflexota bacterium]